MCLLQAREQQHHRIHNATQDLPKEVTNMKQILTLEQPTTLSAPSVQSFVMPSLVLSPAVHSPAVHSPVVMSVSPVADVASADAAVVSGNVVHVAAVVAAANRLENGRIAFGWAAWDTTGAPKSQAMTTSPSAKTECTKTTKTMKPCTRKSNAVKSYAKKYTKRPLSWSGDPNG
jgi:hypothetical protein